MLNLPANEPFSKCDTQNLAIPNAAQVLIELWAKWSRWCCIVLYVVYSEEQVGDVVTQFVKTSESFAWFVDISVNQSICLLPSLQPEGQIEVKHSRNNRWVMLLERQLFVTFGASRNGAKGCSSTWPRLRCDVGLCYIIVCHYNGTQWYKQFLQFSQLDQALLLLGLILYLPSTSVYSWCYIYFKFCLLHSLLYLLVSWVWWDWPLTWLTNNCPSMLWRCWLGRLTRKIVPKMTYNVLSGTINAPEHTYTVARIYVYGL